MAVEIFKNLQHRELNLEPKNFDKKIYVLTDQGDVSNLSDYELITTTGHLSDYEISRSVFYIYFLCDDRALEEIERITELGGIFIPHLNFEKTEYRFTDSKALEAIKQTWDKASRLSHLNIQVHENICEAIALTKNIEGDYVEIGVYMGGSASTAINYLAQLMDTGMPSKKIWLLDTFDGFAYPDASKSSDCIWGGTHKLFGVDQTMNYVRNTLENDRVEFKLVCSNIITDKIPSEIKKISVANIDVDMYEPTLRSLEVVSPLIAKGGVIICEDPASTPGLYGAYYAMHKFLLTEEGKKYTKIFKGAQYFLLKTH